MGRANHEQHTQAKIAAAKCLFSMSCTVYLLSLPDRLH